MLNMHHHSSALTSTSQSLKKILRRIGRAPLILILVWWLTVYWGERQTFSSHVKDCVWNNWETWKDAAANPHHVLLIADPQIVDPHTYPDRPWPLSSLTILYTDLYLKRSYRQLLQQLQPHSTLFLGDLFDGGREWGTSNYTSPDKQYKQYGQDFWMKEYKRFQQMFIGTWHETGMATLPSDSGRTIIASLPGNHDLGFAGGINPRVKSRFEAHFGPLNRVDVLGNHTFVSLDTVSLSAMDPQTEFAIAEDGTAVKKIWKPAEQFLADAKALREQKIKQETRRIGARSPYPEMRNKATRYPAKHVHAVESFENDFAPVPKAQDSLKVATSQFPTIVLSHVPFWRGESSNCGPYRERGTQIPISAGYQYQNVLTPLITRDIVEKLDASQMTMIYSGDDHDYCEIDHDEFTGRTKEITVKSMSWAMGIRRPGVQLASLWNPIDLPSVMIASEYGEPAPGKEEKILNMPKGTVQNHLCLLPDQLSIFIRYGLLLVVTLVTLLVRSLAWKQISALNQDPETDGPLLPTMNGKQAHSAPSYPRDFARNSISSTLPTTSITPRKSQHGGYGNIPNTSRSRSTSPSKAKLRFNADSDDWGNPTTTADRSVYARVHHNASHLSLVQQVVYQVPNWWLLKPPRTKFQTFTKSVAHVAMLVMPYYLMLMWLDT